MSGCQHWSSRDSAHLWGYVAGFSSLMDPHSGLLGLLSLPLGEGEQKWILLDQDPLHWGIKEHEKSTAL